MHDFEYEVTGRWPFPIDMLARDGSRAATPEDQRLIDLYSGPHAPDEGPRLEPVTIRLVIPEAGTRARPLTERWESFDWKVPGDADFDIFRRAVTWARDQKEQRRAAAQKLTPGERNVLGIDGDGERMERH